MNKQYKDTKSMMEDMKANYNWWDKFILNPKIHAMIFHYVDCYDNNKSQYLIEDKRK